ncbi:MAG: radical SAM protein [Candidatus Parvarchaeota archaeon]|nr:radical SAM protein [Candidatus Jingweiarchaeum tengchongense]MCW1297718.1 radical SAM protein [Candidatus Jingweiarchaeum tengchongense]MCW1299728.1 radical SAM protein [Candidatus Jingweiarchaeum tengchongense]MCW1305328.1 radical SAM protein [Candidatus Jingweiarchaeum tengchongense]MCW1311145.1 radical SAM protein [Candidatus Jingweiarchaeum tengchongense]
MINIEKFACGKINFIRKSSGLPLIGHNAFGVIDRGTNLLQVRATTICNLNCIFCSTDAGRFSRTRVNEFIVELEYLLDYVYKVVKFKQINDIEVHLDSLGETMTYPWITELIGRLRENENIKTISMQSNGTLLNGKKIKELEMVGLDRINLSILALDAKLAKILAGIANYDIEKVKDVAKRIAESKIDLLIAPVLVPGYNEGEIPKIIEFGIEIGAGKKFLPFGIQNFMRYKLGRKPKGCRTIRMYDFRKRMEEYEKKYNIKLILSPKDFGIHKAKMLPIPFKKNEKLNVRIASDGRIMGEMIGVARERSISIMRCNANVGDIVKIKILKTKHNLIVAERVK